MNKNLLKITTVSIATIALSGSIAACSGTPTASPMPDEMVGHWVDWTYGKGTDLVSTFPISEIVIDKDGNATLNMDWQYTGKVNGSNGKYEIFIDGGNTSVGDFKSKETANAIKITAEYNSDDTLTVYVEGKDGYEYYGSASEEFKKK